MGMYKATPIAVIHKEAMVDPVRHALTGMKLAKAINNQRIGFL